MEEKFIPLENRLNFTDRIVRKTERGFIAFATVLTFAGYGGLAYYSMNDNLKDIGITAETLKKTGKTIGIFSAIYGPLFALYGSSLILSRSYNQQEKRSHEEQRKQASL